MGLGSRQPKAHSSLAGRVAPLFFSEDMRGLPMRILYSRPARKEWAYELKSKDKDMEFMTQDELMTLFRDFLPAIKCYGDQEISEGFLMDCWQSFYRFL